MREASGTNEPGQLPTKRGPSYQDTTTLNAALFCTAKPVPFGSGVVSVLQNQNILPANQGTVAHAANNAW